MLDYVFHTPDLFTEQRFILKKATFVIVRKYKRCSLQFAIDLHDISRERFNWICLLFLLHF